MPSNNYGGSASLTHNSPALLPPHGTMLSGGIISQGAPPYNQILNQIFLGTQGLDYQARQSMDYQGRQSSQHLTLADSGPLTNTTVPQLTFSENRSVSDTAPRLDPEEVYFTSPSTVATAGYNNLNLPFGGFVIRGGTGSVDNPAAAATSNKTSPASHMSTPMPLQSNIKMRSPESEPSPSVSSSYPRKASFSSSSAAVLAPSEEDLSPATRPAEAPSANRSRSIRRTESPPLDVNNKMTCKFAECAGITFDRRCEWRLVECSNHQPYIREIK